MNSQLPAKKEQFNWQSALIEITKDKDISPERLEKFIDLHIKMENHQAQAAFNEAMAKFQGECPVIDKTKKVDFTSTTGNRVKYNYSPFDEIVKIIGPILSKYGLSYSFNIKKESDGKYNVLVTTIAHSSGWEKVFEWTFNSVHEDNRMNESQRRKSALSYAKRAGLENALGIATADEDDDMDGITQDMHKQRQERFKPASSDAALGDYLIPVGKFKGQKLNEVKREDLIGYCDWTLKNNKEINGQLKQFIDNARDYLKQERK